MMRYSLNIFKEIKNKRLPKKKLKSVVEQIFSKFNSYLNLSIIFVDDEKIKELNQKFLGHNYVTDVISFDLSDDNIILGEVYICYPQAERQAKEYGVSVEDEILRLAIHGVLHLLGFEDDTEEKRKEMNKLEDMFLKKIK